MLVTCRAWKQFMRLWDKQSTKYFVLYFSLSVQNSSEMKKGCAPWVQCKMLSMVFIILNFCHWFRLVSDRISLWNCFSSKIFCFEMIVIFNPFIKTKTRLQSRHHAFRMHEKHQRLVNQLMLCLVYFRRNRLLHSKTSPLQRQHDAHCTYTIQRMMCWG